MKFISVATPLILIPFLSRTLDENNFTIYLYVLVLSIFIASVIEYGFNVSATRLISQARKIDRVDIVTGVTSAKIILVPVAVVLSAAFYLLLDFFKENNIAILYVLFLGIFQGFNSSWYFQGTGKIIFSGVLDSVFSLCQLLFIVLLVKSGNDVYLVLQILLVGRGIYTLIVGSMMIYSEKSKIWNIKLGLLKIKQFHPMVMRANTLFFGQALSLVSGLMLTGSSLSGYLSVDKIIKSCNSLMQPLSLVLFPIMSKASKEQPIEHKDNIIKFLLYSIVLSLFFCFFVSIYSLSIVEIYFGTSNKLLANTLSVLVWQIPLVITYEIIGVQYILAKGYFNSFILSNAAGALLLFLLLLMLPSNVTAYIFAYVSLGVSMLVVTIMLILFYRENLHEKK